MDSMSVKLVVHSLKGDDMLQVWYREVIIHNHQTFRIEDPNGLAIDVGNDLTAPIRFKNGGLIIRGDRCL